jgi:crossover junction endodeoxyribonuclease RuvC
MRIIGVDPGNAVTGFGIIDRGIIDRNDSTRFVAAGVIRGRGMVRGPQRLATIYQRLFEIIGEYQPDAMSLERSFVAINVQSAFALGEARAAAMLAAAHRDLGVFEYNPTDIKLSIAGYGRADKAQVKFMVRRTLALEDNYKLSDDAADALAIALCHLFRAKLSGALNQRPRLIRPPAHAKVRL